MAQNSNINEITVQTSVGFGVIGDSAAFQLHNDSKQRPEGFQRTMTMAQSPMAMADVNFPPLGDEQNDDLPRTFRREKEARAREARERAAQERAAAPSLSTIPDGYGPATGHNTGGHNQAVHNPAVHNTSGYTSNGQNASSQTSGPASAALGVQPRVTADPDYAPAIADMPYPAAVRRFDVPFFHLTTFLIKAVLAAIPALFLLAAVLWIAGAGLQALFPDLIKMKILISFPN
jgi:hypothetical protein